MKNLQELLGDELFGQVKGKLGEDFVLVEKSVYIPKDRFDEVNTQNKDLKAQLAERDTQLTGLKEKAKGSDELSAKIAELEDLNKQAREQYETAIKQRDLDYAFDSYLRDKGAKNTKAAKALFDVSKLTLEDGKLKGADEQLKAIVEENGFLFQPALRRDIGGDPANGGDSSLGSPELADLMKL